MQPTASQADEDRELPLALYLLSGRRKSDGTA